MFETGGWDKERLITAIEESPEYKNLLSAEGQKSFDEVIDLSKAGKMPKGYNKLISTLTDMLPTYSKSVQFMAGLPEMLDRWAGEEVKRYRVTGDEIADVMSQAAGARAGRGIMGGTEDENLRAKLLGEVTARTNEKKSQVLRDAMMAKTTLGPAISEEMRMNAGLLANMFGTETQANINVANLIARLLKAGYTG